MDIEELFGRHAIGIDRPEDYIKWAEEQLASGVNSVNIAILAGLDLEKPVDTREVREYFSKSLDELGVPWPEGREAQRMYAERVCRKIMNDELPPQQGLAVLSRLFRASGYSDQWFALWDELAEDVSSLETEYGAIFNIGITKNNVNEYIRKVAAQYLTLRSMDLPSNFFGLASCAKCGLIAEPVRKQIEKSWVEKLYRVLYKRGPSFMLVCSRCGSGEILSMSAFEGREAYLSAAAER
jgi:hypothetical protein